MDSYRRNLPRTGYPRTLDVPAVATERILALTTGVLYCAGGLLVLVASFFFAPHDPVELPVVRALAALAVVVGVLAAWFGPRGVPRAAYHPLVALGTVVISLDVLAGGGGEASIALGILYIFVVIDAAFFFSPVGALVHVLMVLAASSTAMMAVGLPLGVALLQGLACVVVGVVVAWLARAADDAEQDPLTGMFNRRGVSRRLEETIDRIGRHRGRLTLILLDLDHFKRVNDTEGHVAGDRTLVASATAWREALAPAAALGRYGADTFAVVLPGWSLGQAADVADELRFLMPPGTTASAGVAAWEPGDSASMLLGRADVALFHAKRDGRDRTVVYGDPHRDAGEIEAAVALGEMVLHYQPVTSLRHGHVIGYESLVRWQHPQRGLVPPDAFIPQAERTGAVGALGAWTLAEAIRTAGTAPWLEGCSVSVNVSVRELRDHGYAERVGELLARHGVPADRLTLEITEAAIDDHPQVTENIVAVRRLGARIAIDDFGVGHSSLGRLSKLPVDVLKIDGSFVDPISDPDAEVPLLEAIIAMGHALGARVVAERVETEAQARVLERYGCDFAQGWLFGRPCAAEVWQSA
ncbi:MAG TPA: EAL domain-containing protein [Nocardioides sp.]|uniref:EAL domain-containing protein n=1 Tax=Nocardioides sp. TaxID=35761 RepID=UPI002ED79BAD